MVDDQKEVGVSSPPASPGPRLVVPRAAGPPPASAPPVRWKPRTSTIFAGVAIAVAVILVTSLLLTGVIPGLRLGSRGASGTAPPVLYSPGGSSGWTNVTSTSLGKLPSNLVGSLVYDSEDGYLLFFGVQFQSGACPCVIGGGQTWVLKNGNWTNLTPVLKVSPPPLQDAGLVDDVHDGYVVLFGGFDPAAGNGSGLPGGDHPQVTWTFHAGIWTDRTSIAGAEPPGEYRPAMTYDAASGFVLLAAFNRSPAGTSEFETWSFVDGHWANITAQVGLQPPAREQAVLTYDPADRESVLFGGVFVRNWTDAYLHNDTWAFLSGHWVNVTVPGAPAPSAVSDLGSAQTSGGHVVAFGGLTASYSQGCTPFGLSHCSIQPTWIFVDGYWLNMSTVLPGAPNTNDSVTDPAMAWDPAEAAVVVITVGPTTVWLLHWNTTKIALGLTLWRQGTSLGVPLRFTVAAFGSSPPYQLTACASNSSCLNWTGIPNDTPRVAAVNFTESGNQSVSFRLVDANGSSTASVLPVPVFPTKGLLSVILAVAPLSGFSPFDATIWVNVSGGASPVRTTVVFGDGNQTVYGPSSFVVHHNYTCAPPPGINNSSQYLSSCQYDVAVESADAIGDTAVAGPVAIDSCASNVNGSVCYPPGGPSAVSSNPPPPMATPATVGWDSTSTASTATCTPVAARYSCGPR